jgi:phospholipase C
VLAAISACGNAGEPSSSLLQRDASPELRAQTPGKIRHVVVLMMENRSFDHFLGWLPKADGETLGLTY